MSQKPCGIPSKDGIRASSSLRLCLQQKLSSELPVHCSVSHSGPFSPSPTAPHGTTLFQFSLTCPRGLPPSPAATSLGGDPLVADISVIYLAHVWKPLFQPPVWRRGIVSRKVYLCGKRCQYSLPPFILPFGPISEGNPKSASIQNQHRILF